MIWILILLFAPVLALMYVVYLMLKAIVIIITAIVLHISQPETPELGYIDPVTGKVVW